MVQENYKDLYFLLVPNNTVKADLSALPQVKKIDLQKNLDVMVLLSDFNFPSLRKYALSRIPIIDVRQEFSVPEFKIKLLDGVYARYNRLVCATEKPQFMIRSVEKEIQKYNFLTRIVDLI